MLKAAMSARCASCWCFGTIALLRWVSKSTTRQPREKAESATNPSVNEPVCCLIAPSKSGGKNPPRPAAALRHRSHFRQW